MARHGIGRLRAGGSNDPDAAAWAAAVTAAGGTYSGSTLNALTTFVRAAKAAGYWTKLNRINLFCGNQLAACLVPLKVGGGSATETNTNFVAGDYSEATGLTGASLKKLDTGLLASSLTLNDTHLAVYNRSSSSAAGGQTIGAYDSVTPAAFNAHLPNLDGVFYSDQYLQTVGGRLSVAATSPFGFMVASRTASNSHVIYRNGSSVASNATSGGVLPAMSIYVFVHNRSDIVQYISQPLAGYSIGAGLTAADVTAYNTHMQAFQAALGRSV